MPPPPPLQIATSSLLRLRRELSTYHTELSTQQAHLSRAIAQQKTASSPTSSATNGASAAADEQPAGNLEYEIKQEERAIEETKRMFGPLEEKIRLARGRLEGLVVSFLGFLLVEAEFMEENYTDLVVVYLASGIHDDDDR